MLVVLFGCEYQVFIVVVLVVVGGVEVWVVECWVCFCQVVLEEVLCYWQSGELVDKVGGYVIQGFGVIFVSCIEGSYSVVVGLFLCEIVELLREFGIFCWQFVGGNLL